MLDQYYEKKINLFDISKEKNFEQRWYVNWVKDKLLLIRTMFKRYAKMPLKGVDSRHDKKFLMNKQSVFSFLQNF